MKASEIHETLRDHLIKRHALDKTASELMVQLGTEIGSMERQIEAPMPYYSERVADDVTEALNEGEP